MPELVSDPQRPRAAIVRSGGTDQSYVDLADPTRLEFDYMVRIADHLDTWAPIGQRLRVIHIGGAGMSLARYLAHTRPTSPQIVLEPDTALTDMVRRELPLPPRSGIKVRPFDGRTGLAQMPADYADVVVVDAFADSRVPADLATGEFFAEAKRVLHRGGLVVMNACDHHDLSWTRRLVATVAELFAHLVLSSSPATFKGRCFGNVVLAASDAEHDIAALTRHAAGQVFPYRVLDDAQIRRFAGGARGFTDSHAEASPALRVSSTWFE